MILQRTTLISFCKNMVIESDSDEIYRDIKHTLTLDRKCDFCCVGLKEAVVCNVIMILL